MMIELKTEEQFKERSRAEKERCGKLVSNCLLPGRTVRDALLRGRVLFRELPQGFVLYGAEGGHPPFYTLYYFLQPGAEMKGLAANLPVLLEEPDANDRRAAYLSELEPKLFRAGFTVIAKNILVEIAPESIAANDERYAAWQKAYEENGYRIAVDPCGKQREEAFALWRAHLKPTDLPPGHFDPDAEGAHIVCILDRAGSVCGVNRWELKDGVCEIRHTVTRPDCLRQGIGSFLILYALQDAEKKGMRSAFTYIDEQNVRSLAMYEKIGFRRTEKTCRQYLLPAAE